MNARFSFEPISPSLDHAVEVRWRAARSAWPKLAVSRELFVNWMFGRANDEKLPHESNAADLYLACACAIRARGAIEAFDEVHLAAIARAISRIRADQTFVDEASQSVREKLFVGVRGRPKIESYQGRGPLRSWVIATAVRTALNLLRGVRHAAQEDAVPELSQPLVEPEAEYMKRRYGSDLAEAIRTAFAALAARDRRLLEQYYARDLSIDRLGSLYGVGRSTAWRWIGLARQEIRERTRAELARRYALERSEFDELTRMMIDDLDIGLLRSATECPTQGPRLDLRG